MTTAAPDFPIPADLQGFWVWEKLHAPRPVAPLDQEVIAKGCGAGFNRSMAEFDDIIELGLQFFNYYCYVSFVPLEIKGESKEARLARCQAKVAEFMPTIGKQWESTWLPAMLPGLQKARETDFAKLGDDELLRTFEQLREELVDRWAVHGLINYAFYAAGVFADYYREVLQPASENEGYEALQGFPSIALESSLGLWKISRAVRANPELRKLFEAMPNDLVAQLKTSDAGRALMGDLDAYLERFGWRADAIFDLTRPSWREDPSIALNAIAGYMNIEDGGGPQEQYDSAVKHREQLLTNARAKLANEPEKLAKFNELYETASCFTPIAEDHNHYIDQMGNIAMRYPALEIGRRLVAKGSLAKPEDVHMLYLADVRDAMAGKDQKAIAAQRREEMQRWAQIVPPPVLGMPAEPTGDPVEDLLMRFFGSPVEASGDPSIVTGTAASPGTARGPAKVVRDLSEASKVRAGDILVCEMTLPPWTPLFATVSGVVADTGGILSHCAIVAREYRIPCVVGTAIGTAVLKDGMMLTVDGTKGIVRIES